MNHTNHNASKRIKRHAKRYLAMVRDPYCEHSDMSVAEFAAEVGLRPDVLMRAVREVR